MRNLKLGVQIWIVVGLSWLVGGGAAAFLFYRLEHIVSAYEQLFGRETQQQDLSRQMQVVFKKQVQEWKDILIRGQDPASMKNYTDGFHKDEATVRQLAGQLKNEVPDPDARAALSQFLAAHEALSASYAAGWQKFVKAKGRNQHEVDLMVKGKDRPPTDLIDRVVDQLGKRTAAQRLAISNSLWMFGVGVALGFALVMGLSVHLVRKLNRLLRETVLEIGEGTEQVASAAAQVSTVSQQLAQGASELASSLQQTSASTEQITSITRKSADNAKAASELMVAVDQGVENANHTLAGMVRSMNEIKASSDRISKIIKAIDEIAFQTNILALNAAVEAARAGEAGMGFAVVADEVRNLAQRCAQAAKDTSALIEESIAKSGEGSRRLSEVAVSIQAITEGASKVKTLVDEVEASSKEQATGIQQISKAVSEMDQVTQKTAANAEESASASEQLSAQSQALLAVVEQLQALVGASSGPSAVARKAEQAKRR